MALQFESSQVIDRPIEKVFHFYAVEHVRNHPRWESQMDDETLGEFKTLAGGQSLEQFIETLKGEESGGLPAKDLLPGAISWPSSTRTVTAPKSNLSPTMTMSCCPIPAATAMLTNRKTT